MTGRLVKPWSSRQELEPLVLKALIHAFNDLPQIGWIRGNNAASDTLLEQSNKTLQENADLRAEIALLRKANKPSVENIADFESPFEFKYQSRYHSPHGSARYTDRTAVLTWKQIFLGLAAQLDKARTDGSILSGMKMAMEEAGCDYEPANLNESDKIRIKVQLEALGLIKVYVSKTTQGGVAEFLQLTDKGRAAFIEGMIVRKQP